MGKVCLDREVNEFLTFPLIWGVFEMIFPIDLIRRLVSNLISQFFKFEFAPRD